MRTISWIEPGLDWSTSISGEFAYLASVRDEGLVRLIADDGIEAAVLWRRVAERIYAFGPTLSSACDILVSVPSQPVGPVQTRSFWLRDLLSVSEREVVVVLGPEHSQSYGQRCPEHQSAAKERLERYRLECEQVKLERDEKRREDEELAARFPDEEKGRQFLAGMAAIREFLDLGPPFDPALPKFLDLGLQLHEVGFVPLLPKAARSRLSAVRDAVAASRRGESRTGRYSCTPIATTAGSQAAIVRWTPRTSISPALELKAALEQRFPSALLMPRSFDQAPPELPDVEVEITSLADPDMEIDPDIDDMFNRLEEVVGAMGGSREAREVLRGKFAERGFDAIAWYQPFHRFAEPVWGIHLDARILDCLAFTLAHDLMTAGPVPYHLAVRLAIPLVLKLTLAHEMFHARVEFAATWLELSSHRRRYLSYAENVYKVTRGTSDWLEEALANWSSRDWLDRNLENLPSITQFQHPDAVTRVTEDWLDFSPAGYRDWRVGHEDSAWRRLTNELATSRPHRPAKAKSPVPLEGLLRAESLFDLRQEDIPIYFHGTGVVADIYFSSPSRREVLRVLNQRGYCPEPGRGKGSHQVWRGPNGRVFSVPARDPLSVGVFHQLLTHFGMTKQQYLREVR